MDNRDIKLEEAKKNILDYLLLLNKDEYENIASLLTNTVATNRLVNDIVYKMFHEKTLTIQDAVDEVEISLSAD